MEKSSKTRTATQTIRIKVCAGCRYNVEFQRLDKSGRYRYCIQNHEPIENELHSCGNFRRPVKEEEEILNAAKRTLGLLPKEETPETTTHESRRGRGQDVCELDGWGAVRTDDPVSHPSHYTQGTIETLDFVIDQKFDYCEGNVIKYICRYKYKGKALEDLKKAKTYLDRLILELEKKGE